MNVCPSCGDFVDHIDHDTGWCPPCAGHKTCRRCNTARPLSEYRPDPRTIDGHRGVCSPCLRQAERDRRTADLAAARARERRKMRRYRARTKTQEAA